MNIYPLDFYTSHSQFFVGDNSYPINIEQEFWTEQAFSERLAIFSQGWLSVGTECYGPVKGELRVLPKPSSKTDFTDYDHIVEASIYIKSGVFEIMACTTNEPELSINLPPDFYRIRVYSSNLDSVIDDEGDDYYLIEVWQESFSDKKVLKKNPV